MANPGNSRDTAGASRKTGVTAILEPARSVPVVLSCDVLVLGGGPAGIAAAVASARCGARTALVERNGYLGGMCTAALVGPFAGVRHRYGGGRIVGGIPWELIRRLESEGGALVRRIEPEIPGASDGTGNLGTQGEEAEFGNPGGSERSAHGDVPFDPETMKRVAEQMATEAGVYLRYCTDVCNVIVNHGVMEAVITESKSGRQAFSASVFVDATGDADVAQRAGAAFRKGRHSDGALQPMTLMFRLGGVDTDSLGDVSTSFVSTHIRARAKQLFDGNKLSGFGGPWTFWGSTFRRGEVMVNMVRLSGDGTDVDDLTRNAILARSHVHEFISFFRENFDEFASCHLIDSASSIGIRETRRIVGEYTLTADDLISGREFHDSIALGGHAIDIHSPTGGSEQTRYRVMPYQIPLRCLIPQATTNLLVAGRPISADHEAHASLRVQGTCMATGQAAGIAAACASRTGNAVKAVSAETVQATLRDWNAPYLRGVHD